MEDILVILQIDQQSTNNKGIKHNNNATKKVSNADKKMQKKTAERFPNSQMAQEAYKDRMSENYLGIKK